MRFPHSHRPARRGFTLVELLVATALVVVILTVLAVAFGAATDSLSRLRATGDLATRLRTTEQKLRADLEAPHFVTGDSPAPLRLSDLRYDLLTVGGTQAAPLSGGYFRIEQGSGSIFEGADGDGNISTRSIPLAADTAPLSGHALEFTAYRKGTTADDLYVVDVPGWAAGAGESDVPLAAGQYAFHWARVRWQLGNPQTTGDGINTPAVTTWTLYRDIRVLHPQEGFGTVAPDIVSTMTLPVPTGTADNVNYITDPNTRAKSPIAPYAAGSTRYGDDVVLTNVLSFEVKPVWTAGTGGANPPRSPRYNLPVAATAAGTVIPDGTPGVAPTPAAPSTPNSDYPFDDLPLVAENTDPAYSGKRIFDTWSPLTGWNTPGGANSLPLRIRVTGVKITVRVYDPKTLLTRQISFVVDL